MIRAKKSLKKKKADCYYKRITDYGDGELEIMKYYCPNLGNHSARSPKSKKTAENIDKANQRKREKELYGIFKLNFDAGDIHASLHYTQQPESKECADKLLANFHKRMRRVCKKINIPWEYVCNTEETKIDKIHHHIVFPAKLLPYVTKAWEKVGKLNVCSRLWNNKDFKGLAKYFTDRSKSGTSSDKLEKNEKSYSCSQNLKRPKVTYQKVYASKWQKNPKAPKGYYVVADSVYQSEEGLNYQIYTIKKLC